MAKDTLIVGDSNVNRNYPRLGYQVENVTVISARNAAEVTQALQTSFKKSYKVIILACITNLVITAGEAGSSTTERLSSIGDVITTFISQLR